MYQSSMIKSSASLTSIDGGVHLDTQIIIVGRIPSWWTGPFEISLVAGHDLNKEDCKTADIALKFNPRFNGDGVVMSSRINGQWQNEARDSRRLFQKGQDFVLTITVEEKYYKISVDGQYFANFPHRVPFDKVGLLLIEGRVKIKKIEIKTSSRLASLTGNSSGLVQWEYGRAGIPFAAPYRQAFSYIDRSKQGHLGEYQPLYGSQDLPPNYCGLGFNGKLQD